MLAKGGIAAVICRIGLTASIPYPSQWAGLGNVPQIASSIRWGIRAPTGSPYSITERRVPELIPVLGSQPAGDVNHKPDGRLH